MKIKFDSQGNLIRNNNNVNQKKYNVYAVVGNRKGFSEDRVHTILKREIPCGAIIISGGAIGVDTYAKNYARLNGHPFVEYRPDFSLGFPGCYFDRNLKIAKKCDVIIAFDNKGLQSGTGNTVRAARDLDKKIIIIES